MIKLTIATLIMILVGALAIIYLRRGLDRDTARMEKEWRTNRGKVI